MTKTVSDFSTHFKNRSPRVSAYISACLSLICTLLLPSYLSDKTIGFSNSLVSIAYAAVLFLLFRWYWRQEHRKRELVLTHVFGFMLSCMIAMGRAIDQNERFFPIGFMMCLSILLYTHAFACGVSLLWAKLSEMEAKKVTVRPDTDEGSASRLQKCVSFAMAHPWVIALILVLCWLPCYIALFPGGFSYDMMKEFNQQKNTVPADNAAENGTQAIDSACGAETKAVRGSDMADKAASKDVIADDSTYQIYTIDGKPIEALQKGVNIIKYKDGTSKKVVVK